jgi:1-acyl-sn-glycerol-3-phosphate acyltransferase
LRFKRNVLKSIIKPLFFILFDVEINGRENIPVGKSYVIAYNHISVFEPPFVLAFWPEFPEALAGHDVWDRGGVQGIMVKFFGAIPVKRGEYDRNSVETMLSILQSGKALMISPEGGRSHDIGMRKANAGIAYLVDRADVPVVPVAIIGTRDDSFKQTFKGNRPRFILQIGKPFKLPAIKEKGAARREARQRNADMVMKQIGAMLPEEYHGVYAGQI